MFSPKYSIIIPVLNRPEEIRELLESLSHQEINSFELIVIEDGSTLKCNNIVEEYQSKLDIKYYFKANSGPGDSRNYGMNKASGEYFIFFDSDCLIPENYFSSLDIELGNRPLDAFGGPDSASASFSNTQKAINYAMTSFFTTGGIRGGKKQLDKFQPRSFNMGFTREVYDRIGGFVDIHPGEDPDLSYRIMDAGFRVGLVSEAYVYHKRRIDFCQYFKQVYKFGVVRVILNKWHPSKSSIIYFFPSLFVLAIACLLIAVQISAFSLIPIGLFSSVIFIDAVVKTKSLGIAAKSIVASFIQLSGYGLGFLKSFFLIKVLGKQERVVFPSFFFEN